MVTEAELRGAETIPGSAGRECYGDALVPAGEHSFELLLLNAHWCSQMLPMISVSSQGRFSPFWSCVWTSGGFAEPKSLK